jgi:hypothetical protein
MATPPWKQSGAHVCVEATVSRFSSHAATAAAGDHVECPKFSKKIVIFRKIGKSLLSVDNYTYFIAASTECSVGSNDHFVVGVVRWKATRWR